MSLPDYPCQSSKVVVVGINPAPPSVKVGHYYQGRLGPRIWDRLRRAGLLSQHFYGYEDEAFVAQGHGLTDLVKRPTVSAIDISEDEIRHGIVELQGRLRQWRPGLIICIYKRPAVELAGIEAPTGIAGRFEGIPVFRSASVYASSNDFDRNIDRLVELLDRLGIERSNTGV